MRQRLARYGHRKTSSNVIRPSPCEIIKSGYGKTRWRRVSAITRLSWQFCLSRRALQAGHKKGHPEVANHVERWNRTSCFLGNEETVYFRIVLSASPMSARLRTVFTPAASRAANFSSAVPLPPAMMAPAWPIRLPFGAVTPAM